MATSLNSGRGKVSAPAAPNLFILSERLSTFCGLVGLSAFYFSRFRSQRLATPCHVGPELMHFGAPSPGSADIAGLLGTLRVALEKLKPGRLEGK